MTEEMAGREMSLEEFVSQLPSKHRAYREFQALKSNAHRSTRPEISIFADFMEKKMQKHDDDWGDDWKATSVDHLIEGLQEELKEFLEAEEGFLGEAADVANFAMFIAYVKTEKKHGRGSFKRVK